MRQIQWSRCRARKRVLRKVKRRNLSNWESQPQSVHLRSEKRSRDKIQIIGFARWPALTLRSRLEVSREHFPQCSFHDPRPKRAGTSFNCGRIVKRLSKQDQEH